MIKFDVYSIKPSYVEEDYQFNLCISMFVFPFESFGQQISAVSAPIKLNLGGKIQYTHFSIQKKIIKIAYTIETQARTNYTCINLKEIIRSPKQFKNRTITSLRTHFAYFRQNAQFGWILNPPQTISMCRQITTLFHIYGREGIRVLHSFYGSED